MKNHVAATILFRSGVEFGTSGARGLVSQFSREVCDAFTIAFINVMQDTFEFDRIAVGIDLRPSSPRMALSCVKTIESAGLSVDFCGVVPTPALANFAMNNNIPSIMVTGSHIPFDRNGLKFYRPDGEISKTDEIEILRSQSPLPKFLEASRVELPKPLESVNTSYKKRYTDYFDNNVLSGFRIGLYEHSSAARDVFTEILKSLGAEVVLYGRTDEFVPIDTEAVSEEDKSRAIKWVSESKLDCLISTDGDGDRPMLADENGEWLRGDILGLLCAQFLEIKALAIPVSCNSAVEASSDFAEVVRTRIGSPYVIEGMDQLAHFDRVAGFEANGGFLLGSNLNSMTALPTRDAVLPVLSVLAAAQKQKKTLSELVGALPQRFTASDRIKEFPTDESRALLAKLKNEPLQLLTAIGMDEHHVESVNETDGFRITLSNNQVIHLRPSGNAPELRCYCEAESSTVAEALVKNVLSSLQSI